MPTSLGQRISRLSKRFGSTSCRRGSTDVPELIATDAASKATDAVRAFGGAGYTRDYLVERYMREAELTQILEGSVQFDDLSSNATLPWHQHVANHERREPHKWRSRTL